MKIENLTPPKLAIVSDGTSEGTKIFINGRQVAGISSFSFHIQAGQAAIYNMEGLVSFLDGEITETDKIYKFFRGDRSS